MNRESLGNSNSGINREPSNSEVNSAPKSRRIRVVAAKPGTDTETIKKRQEAEENRVAELTKVGTEIATMLGKTSLTLLAEESPKIKPEHGPATPERFSVDYHDYPFFNQQYQLFPYTIDEKFHKKTNATNNSPIFWGIDQTCHEYVNKTAQLIATLDGTSIEYNRGEEGEKMEKPDYVIYLDKSARPVSWFVNVFWDKFSKEKRPEHAYLNIDRIPWFERVGIGVDPSGNAELEGAGGKEYRRANYEDYQKALREKEKDENWKKQYEENYARIRALFIDGGIKNEDADEVMKTPSKLDGKNILIIDEVKNGGATLNIAKELIEKAIPGAKSVNTAYFWSPGTKTVGNGEQQMLSAPVWYNSHYSGGRGAGEIDDEYYEKKFKEFPNDKTRAQKYGAMVLSSPLNMNLEDKKEVPERSSRELMREIKLMREQFDQGKIMLGSVSNWDDDRVFESLEREGFDVRKDDKGKIVKNYASINEQVTNRKNPEHRDRTWGSYTIDGVVV